MRKNINKIIAFAIGISVMSGGIVPALAADSTQQTAASTSTTTNSQIVNGKPLLTLDEAIKGAISINDTLALDEQKIAAQDKINDLTKKQDDFNDVKDYKDKYDDDTSDAKLSQAKQQRDFDEDSLTQNVTDKYNSIVTLQIQIDKETKNLAVENQKLQEAKLKQNLGVQISIDTKAAELQIQMDQNSLNADTNKLKDAEFTFKTLTGKDVTQYTLEKDIKFEPFKIDGSIDDYLDNVIESDLKYSEQLLKISKDYYNDKDYKSDNNVEDSSNKADADLSDLENAAESAIKPSEPSDDDIANNPAIYKKYQDDLAAYNAKRNNYTNALTARIAYAQAKLTNNQTDTNLTISKKKLKDQLKSYYTNLKTYEDNINYYKKQIELNNEQLRNYKLKYDLGMMTQSDYNNQVVATVQAEINLRNAIISYNQNKEYLQKPWISASTGATLY